MTVPGIIVLFAVLAGILAVARSSPRSGEPRRLPPAGPKPLPRTHYRSLERREEEPAAVTLDAEVYLDPALPLDERHALLELAQRCEHAFACGDGPAIVVAAERALARARTPAARAYVLQLLAHGQALSGEERVAVETLESVPGGQIRILSVRIAVFRRARRYRRALDAISEALEVEDSPALRQQLEDLQAEALRWADAVRALDATDSVPDPLEYSLVRDAGRLKGRNHDAARVGERLFERSPDPDLAWAVAACWSRAKDGERAAEWLLRAAAAGARAPERLHAEFPALAGTESLERIRAAMSDG